MSIVLTWFRQRPLRLIGGLLVFLSIGLLAFMLFLDIFVGLSNPYLGIITYMILPGLLIIGLLLVPVDSWVQRRRIARGEPVYPTIDLCDPHQRRIAGFFAGASIVVLIVLSVVTYKGVEFMDTTTFCGTVCHKVMTPEFVVYQHSSHAGVSCAECHIGPGAPWFVRSKLSGIPQVWHYALGDYPRPLETPVRALRPSRDTCENCHWPEEFYGSTLKTKITYEQDRENTRRLTSKFMHVGSGGIPGSGIHSHMVNEIHYLPADRTRGEIAWVRVKRPDGSTQEFVNPSYSEDLAKIRKAQEVRFMDCIDCHNRAAHDFEPFEVILDRAITRRQVDPTLPFIKREAMNAVGSMEKMPTDAEQQRALRNISRIRDFYKMEHPEVFRSKSKAIDRSVAAIEDAYRKTFFAHMRVFPGSDSEPATYPNWRTHVGCFRCHGVMESTGKGRAADISGDCGFCHTDETEGDPSGLISGEAGPDTE